MSIKPESVLNYSSSLPPCSPDEVLLRPGDCVEEGVEELLEGEAVAGFRVWQLAGIVLSALLAIIVVICCCVRFRIPRTKQEIEADYIRKKITRSFRRELAKIDDTEMDEMDLRRALDRVRDVCSVESEEMKKRQKELREKNSSPGLSTKFNSVIHGIRVRCHRDEPRVFDSII